MPNFILKVNPRPKVRVHGVTRSRTNGMDAVGNCTTPVTIPDRDNMNMRTWRKIESQGMQLFKLYLPRITERNGPICCYRVYLVKLPPQKTVSDLPPPDETVVYSYQYAHSSPIGGAYIAETFDNDQLTSSEVFLGDGESSHGGAMCDKCFGLRPKPAPPVLHLVPEVQTTISTTNGTTTILTSTLAPTTSMSSSSSSSSTTTSTSTVSTTSSTITTTTTTTTTITRVDTTTAIPLVREDSTEIAERRKREDSPVQRASVDGSAEPNVFLSHDGFFDETSNYTGFIEIIGMYCKIYVRSTCDGGVSDNRRSFSVG